MSAGREYYKRSVEGFYRLEHFDLEEMFGRRQRPVLKMSVQTKQHPGNDSKLKDLSFYFLNEGRAVAKYHGFWCRFDDNIEIKGVDVNLKNISNINDNKPTISFENSVGVIHPNGIQVHVGTLTYKKKNNERGFTPTSDFIVMVWQQCLQPLRFEIISISLSYWKMGKVTRRISDKIISKFIY